MTKTHTFHIPVMGTGYTIDTPLKVSQYGIDSVVSLVDDILIEKIRKMYCERFGLVYDEISKHIDDFRAKRITAYLNMLNSMAINKFEEMKEAAVEKYDEFKKYISMLPDNSPILNKLREFSDEQLHIPEIREKIISLAKRGSIDVNIMTKLDKENYKHKEKLPTEYNDAHAALRGYAQSDLESSIVFSAGMNPRLYGYIENFADFFPNEDGYIKKKIILKVSDYRSALIQGRFLAKKGLWISEFRVESGLNCGGHAFATDGYLMGPILQEFNDSREELAATLRETLYKGLSDKGRVVPKNDLTFRVTAQGGIASGEEHNFLLEYYNLDSCGWGTPFLLVPEATVVDKNTLAKLLNAKEEDVYLSDVSPIGVAFNNLRGNSKDVEKEMLIKKGKPGSKCPRKYLQLNKEFTDKAICTASRQYQYKKIKELNAQNLSDYEYQEEYSKITDKSCICLGLGVSAVLAYGLDNRVEKTGVSICPSPTIAYFDKTMKLTEMISHIYGRTNEFLNEKRPNVFVKELTLYIEFLERKVKAVDTRYFDIKNQKYLTDFANNLLNGIKYYQELFTKLNSHFVAIKSNILESLESYKKYIMNLLLQIENLKAA